MPSLFDRLGRTLTRKKSEEPRSKSSEKPPSTSTELDGTYERISTTEAREAPTETLPIQEKPKPLQKRFLRAKSPSARPVPTTRVAVLSLHLPELRDAAVANAQRLTFEATEEDPELMPDAIAKRRLTPPETVYLAKQVSGALYGKGLATLGIFKPHWHSASHDQQHKLITLFLQSITNATTLPPPPGTSLEKFEAQLHNASPHDVADVLKWGLRHLQLENHSFPTVTSSDEWAWYRSFAEAEREAGFPANAYTDLLLPLIPPAHQELLSTFLDIGTSVAAHAEANGVSGSKLTRLVGWWLLSQRKPASNGLVGFIQEWETAARILEHIYLAYIRDHAQAGKMPKRLTQLVKSYPYSKQASPMDQHFLPRPKFTTRRRTALLVRVSCESKENATYRNHPIRLLKDALHANVDKENSPKELLDVWEELKAQAQAHQGIEVGEGTPSAANLTLSALLTEEAIRLLTSASGEALLPASPLVGLSQTSLQPDSVSGHAHGTTGGTASGTSRAPSDWDGFTSAGFEFMGGLNLAGGLQDYKSPPTSPGKTKRTLELSRRASLDKGAKSTPHAHANGEPTAVEAEPSIAAQTVASTLLLDEALIDAWADTLADPVVARAWPTFVLYHLRAPLAHPTAHDHELVAWLVIETYAPASPLARKDTANGRDRDRTREKRSSSRPRFGGFFSSSGAATKDKDKEEGKKKEKDGSGPTRRSSVGVLKEASKSQHSLANQPIAEETEVPPVPKAPFDHDAVVSSAAVTAVAAVAATGIITAAAEAKEEAELTPAAVAEGAFKAVGPTGEEPPAVPGPSEHTRAESLALEEERIARELAAQEEEEALRQRMEAAEEVRVRALEEQRLAAKEEEARVAREAAERAEEARLEEAEKERRLRLEAEELERRAHLQREEEAEAARLEQERLEAQAAEKARLEEKELEAARLEEAAAAESVLDPEAPAGPIPEPVSAPELAATEEHADKPEAVVEHSTPVAAPAAENEAEVDEEPVAADAQPEDLPHTES